MDRREFTGATIRLAVMVSLYGSLAAILASALGQVPDRAIVLGVMVVGVAFSAHQTARLAVASPRHLASPTLPRHA